MLIQNLKILALYEEIPNNNADLEDVTFLKTKKGGNNTLNC